jgi:hypothetical protein
MIGIPDWRVFWQLSNNQSIQFLQKKLLMNIYIMMNNDNIHFSFIYFFRSIFNNEWNCNVHRTSLSWSSSWIASILSSNYYLMRVYPWRLSAVSSVWTTSWSRFARIWTITTICIFIWNVMLVWSRTTGCYSLRRNVVQVILIRVSLGT